MPEPDPPRRSEVDDWFAGLGDETPPRTGRATAVETGVSRSDEPAAPDDWVHAEPASTLVDERDDGRTVTLGTLLAVAAIVVVLILVAGLAVGGVFSGGGKSPAQDTTTALTTTQTGSTTPTTPARPARPVVSAPATTLKPGDQGVQVKRLQRALARLGYAAGAVDGDYGVSTQAAVTRFQKASALTPDGVLGPATLQALKRALQRNG